MDGLQEAVESDENFVVILCGGSFQEKIGKGRLRRRLGKYRLWLMKHCISRWKCRGWLRGRSW
jgi:hypothetical protein